MMKCPHCGSEVPEGKKFCGYCGRQLEGPQEGPPQVPQVASPEPVGFDEDAETQLLPLEGEAVESPAPMPASDPEPEAAPEQPDTAHEPTPEPEEPLREPLKPSAPLGPASKPAPIPETSRRKLPAWIWVIGALLLALIGWRLLYGAGASPAIPTEDPYAYETTSAPTPASQPDWGPIEGQVDGMDSVIDFATVPDYFDFYADISTTEAGIVHPTALQFHIDAENGANSGLELHFESQEIWFIVCDPGGACDGWDDQEYVAYLSPEMGEVTRLEIWLWNDTLHYVVNGHDLGGYAFPTGGRDVTIGAVSMGENEFSITYGVGWP